MSIRSRFLRLSGEPVSKAYCKDIGRSIQKGWKRLFSILIITALGVTMLTGLYAACADMYYSADRFFDRQNLFDIRIVSTLGLTKEDVDTLTRLEAVQAAEGSYNEIVHTETAGVQKTANMMVLSRKGLNKPYLLDGKMPTEKGEAAVTQKYLEESGCSLGDPLTITEDEKAGGESESTPSKENGNDAKDSPKENSISDTDIDLKDMKTELEETESPTFSNTTYTITGVVLDPMNIQNSNGTSSLFRSTDSSDYTFFITEKDADFDVFTAVYLTLDGTQEMNSYSDEYDDRVQSVIANIEDRIKKQREKARYDSVVREARTKVQDAENTANDKFAEADRKFADAWDDIDKARQELADGEAALTHEQKSADRQMAEARAKLENYSQKLSEGEKQLTAGETQLNEKAEELEQNSQRLVKERQQAEDQFAAAEDTFQKEQNKLNANRHQLEEGTAQLKSIFGDAWPEKEWNALVRAAADLAEKGAKEDAVSKGTAAESAALAKAFLGLQGQMDDLQQGTADTQQNESPQKQDPDDPDGADSLPETGVQTALGLGMVTGGQQLLDAKKSSFEEQKASALQQMSEAGDKLNEGKAQITAARQELESHRTDLKTGKIELAKAEEKLNAEEARAKEKIADARKDISDGKTKLSKGQQELTEQEKEYAGKKEEAKRKLNDAYAELDDIELTQWYVQDRTTLDSYSSLDNDLSSIETVGHFFPVIFLLVAILMSLTTMTRMVEEERGMIGTYKALGFGGGAIYRKYLLFAFCACLLGGIVGDIGGFVLLPKFIAVILKELYTIPQYYLQFDLLYGVGGVLLFTAAIVGATALACHSELKHMPAALLRPRAPRAGSRIFLEYIPAFWSRLKFLNKVTLRNLFRYKKRLFMTVGGIMGCTALLVCGFAIKDSIADLGSKQYDRIYQYDLMTVFDEKEHDEMVRHLTTDKNVGDYMELRIDSMKLINAGGEAEKVQLMVLPDDSSIKDYIRLESPEGKILQPKGNGVLITQSAKKILALKAGDAVSLQNMELEQQETRVSGIVKNYLGNNVYMTQKQYESLFGDYEANGVLAHLTDACTDPGTYAEELQDNDAVLSAVSTAKLKEEFGFDLIDAVVLLFIVMAGGLALVVLFTLSNTNISERVRELATIKVLGFYDKEVYQYVNRETLILSLAGILFGLPLGRFISSFLTTVLNMPSIYFAVHIEPVSYLLIAAITFFFAILVNWFTNRTLNRIDMVEALKSPE